MHTDLPTVPQSEPGMDHHPRDGHTGSHASSVHSLVGIPHSQTQGTSSVQKQRYRGTFQAVGQWVHWFPRGHPPASPNIIQAYWLALNQDETGMKW